jgi:uncharacterized repeat protein (TIGR03803 family)
MFQYHHAESLGHRHLVNHNSSQDELSRQGLAARPIVGEIDMTLVITTLATTSGVSDSSLILDANGDLFGTTVNGGNNGQGTVFEIVKTGNSYASTSTQRGFSCST